MDTKGKYVGRGTELDRMEYLDFINYVFGFNGKSEDFLTLLPNLYKEQYNPCYNSYIAKEDGKLVAGIGIFPRDICVGGEILHSHGVGNVAVHPRYRSRGYMKDCLNLAIREMIENGADLSDLGGQRQRYQWFSYDTASVAYSFQISSNNLRHVFGNSPYDAVTFREVTECDTEALNLCYDLFGKKPCHMGRTREAFLDTAHAGHNTLYGIYDGEAFIGYCIGALEELTLADVGDFDRVIRTYLAGHGSVNLVIAPWDTALMERASALCEGYSSSHHLRISVFHYAKVVSAFLKLKSTYTALPDGCQTVLVHGIAGDECFTVSVSGGVPTVTPCEGNADIELSHLDAIEYFFGAFHMKRQTYAPAMVWYPLPLFLYHADHV